MFKKEFLTDLEKKLGYEEGVLTNAANSETEIEVAQPTAIIRSQADDQTRDTNLIENARKGIIEVGIKKFGQTKEFGEKVTSFDALFTAIEEKAKKDAGEEPTLKYKNLEKKAKLELQSRDDIITAKEKELETIKGQVFTIGVKSKALSGLKSETIIPKEDVFALFTLRKAMPTKGENGNIVGKDVLTGEIIKDKNLVAIPFNDLFNTFVDASFAKKVDGAGGGKGGEKNKDGVMVFNSMQDWEKHYGDEAQGEAAQKSLAESMKVDTFEFGDAD